MDRTQNPSPSEWVLPLMNWWGDPILEEARVFLGKGTVIESLLTPFYQQYATAREEGL